MSRIAITGATGFVGRALVRHARAQGHEVLAIVRKRPDPAWAKDAGITSVAVDLGDADSVNTLTLALADTAAVIHAAASFGGDAAAHARDTIAATAHLIRAMTAAPAPARLVLVSSLSVYDVAAMQDHDVLDEKSPLLHDAAQRDAYAAAKAAQERMIQEALGDIRILRPGAIYGPNRLWSAQLGFAKGGIIVCPGGRTAVPAVHVDHVAAGLLAAVHPDQNEGIINLIDPNPPQQTDWLKALGRKYVRLPRGVVLAAGRILGRGPAWSARFRPLRYDTTRADKLLNAAATHSFVDAITDLRRTEQEPT